MKTKILIINMCFFFFFTSFWEKKDYYTPYLSQDGGGGRRVGLEHGTKDYQVEACMASKRVVRKTNKHFFFCILIILYLVTSPNLDL